MLSGSKWIKWYHIIHCPAAPNRIINAPTAAAIASNLHQRLAMEKIHVGRGILMRSMCLCSLPGLSEYGHMLCKDVGAATTDVTLLLVEEGIFETLD